LHNLSVNRSTTSDSDITTDYVNPLYCVGTVFNNKAIEPSEDPEYLTMNPQFTQMKADGIEMAENPEAKFT